MPEKRARGREYIQELLVNGRVFAIIIHFDLSSIEGRGIQFTNDYCLP